MYVGVLFIAGYFLVVPGLCSLGVWLFERGRKH